MIKLIYIALGGSIGAVLRYGLSGLTHQWFGAAFPWGTLCVNMMGSLGIGLLWGFAEVSLISPNVRLFLFIGVLGSFTTFSAFTLETFHLLRNGEWGLAGFNAIMSVVLGTALVFVGYTLGRLPVLGIK